LSIGQPSAKCLALITEVNGEVFIKKGQSESTKAYWGAQLFQGDEIKTSGNSEVKLLFSNNSLVSLGPNSTIKISGKEPLRTETNKNVKNISSAMMVDLSTFTLKDEGDKEVGALAGLRSGGTDLPIVLVSPYNSFIKTNRPSFSWETKKSFDAYTLNLYNSKGLVWSKKVSGITTEYPASEKELQPGESYYWNITGQGIIEDEKSDNNKFTLLPAEKLKEVETRETEIKYIFRDEAESSSYHSVLGALYINMGLLQDAISEFQIISRINSDASTPHEILGSLYSEVGSKDKAIAELQKALEMAKNNNK
jgi:tetratricopeptide (TPR) repeat protein